MAWDFSTEPEYQERLDWARQFVIDEVRPLTHVFGSPWDKSDQRAMAVVRPLQDEVRAHGLWACHLGPELGGAGYGQLKLALLNEILGMARWAPSIFGCQAPDSGNAEILARYGTDEQKRMFLEPLVAGEISSCYSMTEPQAGADPALFETTAKRDGDEWVIEGEKWFASNARWAAFLIVMVRTDDTADVQRAMSMFIVPAGTPGLEIIRNVGIGTEQDGSHAYLRFDGVRVPADHLLGEVGGAFEVAQARLGGGRIHHAMRTIAQLRRAFDLMCERAVSRRTRTGTLASLQMTQEKVADSWIEIEQFRLLVLRTAWLIDQVGDYASVREHIAAVKAVMPKVYHDVVQRALHLHGSLGISNEMPFAGMLLEAEIMGLADGPTEVHKLAVAKQLLRRYTPGDGRFPSGHLLREREAARAKFADLLEQEVAAS